VSLSDTQIDVCILEPGVDDSDKDPKPDILQTYVNVP
jgi:hypothetical protein